jgi:DNA polymerase-3 subunit beta
MKIAVSKDSLAHSLNLVIRAVGLKPALPVLNNLLLELGGGQLKLAATNLETSMVTLLAVKDGEDGSITVPARLLYEFVSSVPEATVTMETNDENLVVKAGKYEAKLSSIAASEFPKIPQPLKTEKILVDKGFAKALNQTGFAASTDPSRPVLTGTLLEFTPNQLNLVATDGYRLAKKTLKIDSTLQTTLLIPTRALSEVARLIGEAEDEVEISLQPLIETNQVIFTVGQTQITTRLLDGTFPPYQTIIPQSFKTRAVMETDALSQAVKATSLFARDLGNVVNLSIDPAKKELEFVANTAQVGTGKTTLSGSVEGEEVAIAFNSHYISSGLSVINTTQISMETVDSTKPALLKGVGDDTFFYIIMPVRLQG